MDRKINWASPLEVVIIVVLALVALSSLSLNLMFKDDNAVKNIFGNIMFVNDSASMEPEVQVNAFVISKEVNESELKVENVVLCKVGEEKKNAVLRIKDIVDKDGINSYYLNSDKGSESTQQIISANNIIGKCVNQSKTFGWIVKTVKTISGVIMFMVIPCIIILLMEVIHFIKKRTYDYDGNENDDNYDNEYDEESEEEQQPVNRSGRRKTVGMNNPIFVADENTNKDDDFKLKKQSIAENFSHKRVDKNAQYQQAGMFEKKVKRNEANSNILFDVNDKDNVQEAKYKADERLKRAISAGGGTEIIKSKADWERPRGTVSVEPDTIVMKRKAGGMDENTPFERIIPEATPQQSFENKDNNARNYDRTSAAEPVSPSENDIKTAKLNADIDELIGNKKSQTKKIFTYEQPTQPAEAPVVRKVQSKPVQQTTEPQKKRSAINASSFDDLMKAIEAEKEKLK